MGPKATTKRRRLQRDLDEVHETIRECTAWSWHGEGVTIDELYDTFDGYYSTRKLRSLVRRLVIQRRASWHGEHVVA